MFKFSVNFSHLLALLCLNWLSPIQAAVLDYEITQLPRLHPAASAAEAIAADGPLSKPLLANNGALYFLGKSFLWRWYPLTGDLKRISIPAEIPDQPSNKEIAISGASVFLFSGGLVRNFTADLSQMTLFSGKWPATCTGTKIVELETSLLAIGSCGASLIDIKNKKISPYSTPESLTKATSIVSSTDCKCLYAALGKKLIKYDFGRFIVTEKAMYAAKAPLLGVALTGNSLAAWTEHALLGFNQKSGTRVQVVPASGNRRIVAAGFSTDLHLILFRDGVLEVMLPSRKKGFMTKSKPLENAEIIMDPAGAFALLVSASNFEVVALSGLQND